MTTDRYRHSSSSDSGWCEGAAGADRSRCRPVSLASTLLADLGIPPTPEPRQRRRCPSPRLTASPPRALLVRTNCTSPRSIEAGNSCHRGSCRARKGTDPLGQFRHRYHRQEGVREGTWELVFKGVSFQIEISASSYSQYRKTNWMNAGRFCVVTQLLSPSHTPCRSYKPCTRWGQPPTLSVSHARNNDWDHSQLCPRLGQRLGQWTILKAQRRKDLAPFEAKSLIHMVGVAGFELATPCTPCKCATRLRYTPTSLPL